MKMGVLSGFFLLVFSIGVWAAVPDVNLAALRLAPTLGAADVNYSFAVYADSNFPVFASYAKDGNVTIDFNIWDADLQTDANLMQFVVDLNYSTGSPNDTNYAIVTDLNLSLEICDSNNAPDTNRYTCHYDWTIASLGDYNIWIIAQIWDGNRETASSDTNYYANATLGIDNNEPSTSWDGNHNTMQTTDANVHLTCADSYSGCLLTRYRLDTDASATVSYGAWATYDTNVLVSTDGNWAIDFNSTDLAGNKETTITRYILIDKTAPVRTNAGPTYWDHNSSSALFQLRVTTDENATCKYGAVDTTYANLPEVFSTSNGTLHTANDTNWPIGRVTRYVRCSDSYSNANSSSTTIDFNHSYRTITIAAPDSGTYWKSDVQTIDFNVIDYNGMGTDGNANAGLEAVNDMNVIVRYYYYASDLNVDANVIDDSNSIVSNKTDTNMTCVYDSNTVMRRCTLSWYTGAVPDGNYRLDINAWSYASGAKGTGRYDVNMRSDSFVLDSNNPWAYNLSPSGTQTSSTVTLSLSTNEATTCRYSTSSSATFDSIGSGGNFTTTGGTTHSTSISGLSNTSYSYYFRCRDYADNNSNDTNTSFTVSVASTTTTSSGGSGGAGLTSTATATVINKNETKFITANNAKDSGVLGFEISAKDSLLNVFFELYVKNTWPAEVPKLEKPSYKLMEIKSTVDMTKTTNGRVTISFEVSKDWVAQNKTQPEKIVMKRLANNAWGTLPTKMVRETTHGYKFTAETPGFSYFAIVSDNTTSTTGTSKFPPQTVGLPKTDQTITKSPEPNAGSELPPSTNPIVGMALNDQSAAQDWTLPAIGIAIILAVGGWLVWSRKKT